jgi:starch phosphorylase
LKPVRSFRVAPALPEPLRRLRDLAYNLRWTWSHDTIELFRRLDSELWETTGHNPVLLLGTIDQSRLEEAAGDEAFLAHLDRAYGDLDAYLNAKSTWFRRAHQPKDGFLAAYFSAEFGLTDCVSIFAGGLGILAGDHLKSASDLGVPLVGVGLLYQQGYFRQYLNEGGWQQEGYEDNDFYNLPLLPELDDDRGPLTVSVDYPGRSVFAKIWKAQVGRVPLYLLDTNIDSNSAADRDITDQLYGGDAEMRIQQEILLGIGGYRALDRLGLTPTVYHLNEGHSAFLTLERLRRFIEKEGLSFHEAREAASAGTVFTTHTAVAAGIDLFAPELVEKYLGAPRRKLGISRQEFLGFGRENPSEDQGPFSMPVFALRMSCCSNAVSRLHGRVSRGLWKRIWPQLPEDDIPIMHVTNGVHYRSWISKEMKDLYLRYLGPSWSDEPAEQEIWKRVERIPAEELWRAHERRREKLVSFVRRRLKAQLERRGATPWEINVAEEVLSTSALTIGFARRFATYKRATLLFRDPERLERLLCDPDRPVQIIVAGKAHPRDDEGKKLVQEIIGLAGQERFRRHIVFVEDYDMAVGRYLVQGADVWLNTPRRPLEACGTSGMKAAANGALNLSTPDGWWEEVWRDFGGGSEPVGWSIGRGESYSDTNLQDQVESDALYELLEKEVIPTFYDRRDNGLPRRWLTYMKRSVSSLCHFYNAHRMTREYTERLYLPAHVRYQELTTDDVSRAKALTAWKKKVHEAWSQIKLEIMETAQESKPELVVGDEIQARVRVHLGPLSTEDVTIQLYWGTVDSDDEIVTAEAAPMYLAASDEKGAFVFESRGIQCKKSGLHGYTIRVLPNHPDLATPFLPGLVTWGESRENPKRSG